MPWPTKGESKQHYISRAIPEIMKDKGKDSKQAAAQAYGMWGEKKPAGQKGHRKVRRHKKHEATDFEGFKREVLEEKFATMAYVRPKSTKVPILLSIYKNPSQGEMRKYVAVGARGYLTHDGTVYLEGYEEPDESGKKRITSVFHGPVLQTIQKIEPEIFGDVGMDWAWDHITQHGITIQRQEDSNIICLGELLDDLSRNDRAAIKTMMQNAKEKNPYLEFESHGVPYKKNTRFTGWGSNGAYMANRIITKPPEPKHIINKFNQGVFEEKFVTMERTGHEGGWGDHVPSVLISLYLNPTSDEIRNFIADGSRGYLCANGDLYLEGYEKEEGGSKRKSSVVHGVVLQALQRFNPKLIRDVQREWENTTNGVTIQRRNSTNRIYVGQSVDLDTKADMMRVNQMFIRAKKKNPHFEFIADFVDRHRTLPGKIPDLVCDLAPRKRKRKPKPILPQLPVHNKFAQGVFEEGVDLSHAYPTEIGRYDAPGFRHFEFSTDTGLKYKLILTIDDIFYREGGPKFMEPLFGIVETDENGDDDFSYKRREVGVREMFRVLATVVKTIVNILNEDPTILAITFDAEKDEDKEYHNSRQRSYRSMAAQLAKYLDWNYAVSGQGKQAEKYYVVCPQLPETAIEEMLRHHEENGPVSVFSQPKDTPVDPELVARLKGKMSESFVTMARCTPGRGDPFLMSIYKNPTPEEMQKYVAFASRGYINHLGDLYLEGYEKEYGGSKNVTGVMHGVILQILKRENPRIIRGDPDDAWSDTKNGVTVQRFADSNKIYVGESVTEDRGNIKQLMDLAAKKNPYFLFVPQSIAVRGKEGRGEWNNLSGHGRRVLKKPAKKVQEGIGEMYYWKDGGPTRYQNTPNSFDDIDAHKAGMALAKGFGLNKREVVYSGPVVGDSLHTIYEGAEDKLGAIIKWNTLRGEEHCGPVVEIDGNIVFVDCGICGKKVAIEDGVDLLESRTRLREMTRLEDCEPYPYIIEDNEWMAEIEGTKYIMMGAFIPLSEMAPGMFELTHQPIEDSLESLPQLAKVDPAQIHNCFFQIVNKEDPREVYQGGGDELQKAPELVPLAGRIFATAIKVLKEHMGEYENVALVSYMSRSRKHLYQRLAKSMPGWSVLSEFDIGDLHFMVLAKDKLLHEMTGACPVCHGKGTRTKKDGTEMECSYCDGVGKVERLNEFFDSLSEDMGGVGLSGNFATHAPEHMIGINGVANLSHNKGTGNTKHGKMDDRTWDSAYTRTRSEDYLREEALQEDRPVQNIDFHFPPELVGHADIHSAPEIQGVLNSFGRGVVLPEGSVRIGDIGSSHSGLLQGVEDGRRFYWGYRAGSPGTVYVVAKNSMDESTLRKPGILKIILSQVFNHLRLNVASGGLKFNESYSMQEKKNKFEKLKKNRVNLTPEEHAEVIKRKAVWTQHTGTVKNRKTKVEAAVWKSVDPKTGETTYVTNTHRAYNTAPTLKGAIGRFHKFIKSTA